MKYILLLVAFVAITCAEQEDFTQDLNALVRKFPPLKPLLPDFKTLCEKYNKFCKLVKDNVVVKKETKEDDVKLQFPWGLLIQAGFWVYNTFFKKK